MSTGAGQLLRQLVDKRNDAESKGATWVGSENERLAVLSAKNELTIALLKSRISELEQQKATGTSTGYRSVHDYYPASLHWGGPPILVQDKHNAFVCAALPPHDF